LSTKVLPQAMAMGYIHIGTIAGKLNGVMPATTPSGWRIE
jgi:allophanate hydrolase subunit 1